MIEKVNETVDTVNVISVTDNDDDAGNQKAKDGDEKGMECRE